MQLLQAMGIEVREANSGCCGMAGAFGFERGRKHEVSLGVARRELVPNVEKLGDDVLLIADGFSCREQVRQLTGRLPLHSVEVLARALDEASERQ